LSGRTLLDWQLDALRTAGVSDVAVVRGYRGSQIDRPGLVYFDNPDWAGSNIVFSLRCAREWLSSSPCVVSYGDIVYHPHLVSLLLKSSAAITIAYDLLWRSLWEERFHRPEDDAESFRVRNGLIVEIGRKGQPVDSICGQYLGLFKLTPTGWARMDEHLSRLNESVLRRLDVTSLLQSLIDQKVRIHAVPVRGRWCEVDHRRDVELYEHKIKTVKQWSHDWRDPKQNGNRC
jgi:choline kinase